MTTDVTGPGLISAGPGAAFDVEVLTRSERSVAPAFTIRVAGDQRDRDRAADLRRAVFVDEQQLFADHDRDRHDEDDRSITLIAEAEAEASVLGTVRLAPAVDGPDLGWWTGSRLAVRAEARGHRLGVGSALVRAACAHAESLGALRFDADVQSPNVLLFRRLGWEALGEIDRHGRPHQAMTWPIGRIQQLADRSKRRLGGLLAPMLAGGSALGGRGFLGDDGAPVPGSDLIAATDAIVPSMVERDPEWAGWCSVLVNVNDLAAMGAEPVALLDALAARDASFATRVINGLARAARAWGVPIIGGHTQLGVPAALSVTALGRASEPVPGGGGRAGQELRVTADLAGDWRAGYRGRQWDSTSARTTAELQTMGSWVARARPAAAKDVSMAGLVGTTGMLAEASDCAAEIEVAALPRPNGAAMGDWLTCFPGFAMITADVAGAVTPEAGPATSVVCGELRPGSGVTLRWPDGRRTRAVDQNVTGLGTAR